MTQEGNPQRKSEAVSEKTDVDPLGNAIPLSADRLVIRRQKINSSLERSYTVCRSGGCQLLGNVH